MFPYYQITLPLPTSVNSSHTVGKGYFNRNSGKWERVKPRSKDYREWIAHAGRWYRQQYPEGVQKFTGRLRVDYIFIWHENDKGVDSSDIGNREKCLSDFLEKKFFDDDKAIDEQHHYRRIVNHGENRVLLRIYEINDRRYDNPELIFNPKPMEKNHE